MDYSGNEHEVFEKVYQGAASHLYFLLRKKVVFMVVLGIVLMIAVVSRHAQPGVNQLFVGTSSISLVPLRVQIERARKTPGFTRTGTVPSQPFGHHLHKSTKAAHPQNHSERGSLTRRSALVEPIIASAAAGSVFLYVWNNIDSIKEQQAKAMKIAMDKQTADIADAQATQRANIERVQKEQQERIATGLRAQNKQEEN